MPAVLIIEDDSTLREVFRVALANAGFSVFGAENGEEGLRIFAEQACDLVITDILMPVKEGYETIIELKRLQQDIQIIAISGGGRIGSGQDLLRHAQVFGAQHTMPKPIVMKDMVALVRS